MFWDLRRFAGKRIWRAMERAELIAKMRGRIEMCRRLAQSTTDPHTAKTLRQLAAEGERDLKALEGEPIEIILDPLASPAARES